MSDLTIQPVTLPLYPDEWGRLLKVNASGRAELPEIFAIENNVAGLWQPYHVVGTLHEELIAEETKDLILDVVLSLVPLYGTVKAGLERDLKKFLIELGFDIVTLAGARIAKALKVAATARVVKVERTVVEVRRIIRPGMTTIVQRSTVPRDKADLVISFIRERETRVVLDMKAIERAKRAQDANDLLKGVKRGKTVLEKVDHGSRALLSYHLWEPRVAEVALNVFCRVNCFAPPRTHFVTHDDWDFPSSVDGQALAAVVRVDCDEVAAVPRLFIRDDLGDVTRELLLKRLDMTYWLVHSVLQPELRPKTYAAIPELYKQAVGDYLQKGSPNYSVRYFSRFQTWDDELKRWWYRNIQQPRLIDGFMRSSGHPGLPSILFHRSPHGP